MHKYCGFQFPCSEREESFIKSRKLYTNDIVIFIYSDAFEIPGFT